MTLFDNADGHASFIAPEVAASTILSFQVTDVGCSIAQIIGTARVSIEVATVNFTRTEVGVGEPVDLSLCTMLVGSPDGAQSLFFITPGAGVTHTYDLDTTTLTVTAANPGDTLEVVIQVFGSAGLLASSTGNMVTVVAAPAAPCP